MNDVEVWEHLAEWERYTNDRSVEVNDNGTVKVGAPFNMSACDGADVFYGHGATATEAARELLSRIPNIPERPPVPHLGPVEEPAPCATCRGYGMVDDRGSALTGQPYFDVKPCPSCTPPGQPSQGSKP